MSTFMAKPHQVEQKWYVIDAEGKTLGRVASEAASILNLLRASFASGTVAIKNTPFLSLRLQVYHLQNCLCYKC